MKFIFKINLPHILMLIILLTAFTCKEKDQRSNDSEINTTSTNHLSKNGKRILKVSQLRGLLLGKYWIEVEEILGKADERYTGSNNESLIYFYSAIDDFDNEIRHMNVFIVKNYVKEVWTCKPGQDIQINGMVTMTTPK